MLNDIEELGFPDQKIIFIKFDNERLRKRKKKEKGGLSKKNHSGWVWKVSRSSIRHGNGSKGIDFCYRWL